MEAYSMDLGGRQLNIGELVINDVEALSILKKDFDKEKHMVDYIENNIVLFCKQCLGIKYHSHIREFKLESHKIKSRSVDLLIRSTEGETFLVECKNPRYLRELHSALGQIMNYSYLYGSPCKMIIVSSKFDMEIVNTAKKFNIDFRLIGLDKEIHLVHE